MPRSCQSLFLSAAALLLLLPWMHLSADGPQVWNSLKLTNGAEFLEARLLTVEPSGIKVMHASGIARIPFEKLPDEVRALFHFDPAEAAAHRLQLVAQEREARVRIAAEEEAVREAQRQLARKQAQKPARRRDYNVPGEIASVANRLFDEPSCCVHDRPCASCSGTCGSRHHDPRRDGAFGHSWGNRCRD